MPVYFNMNVIKCVYKLSCLDLNITEFYVGSTVDYHSRMNDHSSSSTNLNDRHYCLPLYMFINVNGGMSRWKATLLEKCATNITLRELRLKEQKWKDILKPTLNSYNAVGVDEEKLIATKLKHNKTIAECDLCHRTLLKNNLGRHIRNCHGSHKIIKELPKMIYKKNVLVF